MFKKILILPILILFFATSLNAQDWVRVKKVSDGDTLLLTSGDRVRLIGIDTPETKPNQRAKKQVKTEGRDLKTIISMGEEAKRFVESLVRPEDKVRVEFDVEKKDHYGRLLGYVYLSDGKMLNEEILRAGYASLLTVPPNVKYQKRFLKAYREARENKRGLWK